MGALGFGPFLVTTDPSTPNSFELIAFRDLLIRCARETTVEIITSADAIRPTLMALKQRIEEQRLGYYSDRRVVFLKHALACLFIPQICAIFDTKIVIVRRPVADIEQTRLRRGWPESFGSKGAKIIYRHLDKLRLTQNERLLEINYPDLIASPLAHARTLARFAGLKPNRVELQRAATFITRRN